MPGVAWRNRVFGGTLKLREYEQRRHRRERDRNISNAAETTRDSCRVVVMLISHLPNRTPCTQSDPLLQVFPSFVSLKLSLEGIQRMKDFDSPRRFW